MLGADSAALSLHREHEFVVQHSYGFATDLAGSVMPERQERHSMLALRTQQVLAIEDARIDPRVDAAHLNAYGVAAVIVVPLVLAGKAIGALYFNFARPRHFEKTELAFARRLGASLSLAIENARLLESEARRARVNEALARIDHSIHATLDRDEILQRVALESAEAIGADSTVLCILEGDLWVVKYAHNLSVDVIGQGFTIAESPFMGIAAATQRPVAIDDAYNDPRAVYETQRFLGVRAVMMTSLIAREQVIGGLFFNYSDIHHFTPEEIEYTSRLALSVGLAIENGRLYEAERTIASRLQEALLTMPEHVSGIDFAYSYRSATEGMLVGGDFYDIFEVGDQRVGLTVGDVAGKGLDAAVLTSLAKNTIRAHATEGDKTPGEVLALTNGVLYGATPPESFITVFFGVLDCRNGRLVYSSAAHPAAVVLRDDGDVELLQATGPLLGVFRGPDFGQSEIELAPGERLFLYTDGLTEARGAGEFYGDERMMQLLSATRNLETRLAVERITRDVVTFSRNNLRDDVAILAVDYVACPRRM